LMQIFFYCLPFKKQLLKENPFRRTGHLPHGSF